MNAIIVFCANYLLIFVVLGTGIAWLKVDKATKLRFAVAAIIGGIVALVLSRIAGHVYFDPRPFVSRHVVPLIPHAADNGFPSDHALFTGMLTAITYFYSKKIASVMLLLTIAVGVARVLANVHSPLDILAAWILGTVGAVVGYIISSWLYDRYGHRGSSA